MSDHAGAQRDISTPPVPAPDFDERIELVLQAACSLHANGQETEETLAAAARLSRVLGLRTTLFPQWGDLSLQVDMADGRARVRTRKALPSTWTMERVVKLSNTVDAVVDGRIPPTEAAQALDDAGNASRSSLLLFVVACAVGAVALSVINGSTHWKPLVLICAVAGVGGALRRYLGDHGGGILMQFFAASLLAGLVGAWAVHAEVSSPMRLVALGPLMVMYPGPAILNGTLDLIALRVPLGSARLGFAALEILAIACGVMIGLSLGGETVPPSPPSVPVSLWVDTLAAGVAAAAYGIFYSMRLQMIAWPVVVGMAAHAVHWWSIDVLHQSVATAAGLGCLLAGVVLTPVCRRWRLPFAAVGFASVVSMIPGTTLVRMSGGLLQLQDAAQTHPGLGAATLADGITALLVVIAMTLGLVVPSAGYRAVASLRVGFRRRPAQEEHSTQQSRAPTPTRQPGVDPD